MIHKDYNTDDSIYIANGWQDDTGAETTPTNVNCFNPSTIRPSN